MSLSPDHGLREGHDFNLREVASDLVRASQEPLRAFLENTIEYEACPGFGTPRDHIRQMVKISESTGKNLVSNINSRSLVATPQSSYEDVASQYEAAP